MAEFLARLTDQDRANLTAKAERVSFGPDEVIIAEGATGDAIFVVREGSARVERSHMDYHVEVATLLPGELFGEMAFIEGVPASASVIAQEATQVEIIRVAHVRSLIEADPGFYGRFYQSLAEILSKRLRETTDVGLAEFSWGGRVLEDDLERAPNETVWGGGSPLREAAQPAGDDEGED